MQLEFEYVFADKSYPGMAELSFAPTSEGYLQSHVWRSTDLGQNYRVVIIEDPLRNTVTVTITKISGTLEFDECTAALDFFYPNREATRLDSSSQGNSMKFAVWPGQSDADMTWRNQLVGQ